MAKKKQLKKKPAAKKTVKQFSKADIANAVFMNQIAVEFTHDLNNNRTVITTAVGLEKQVSERTTTVKGLLDAAQVLALVAASV